MIINGRSLELLRPIIPFVSKKVVSNGVSYGLSHAGYDVRIAQDVTLSPFKRLALASTFEHFDMPQNVMAIAHDKSTWARRGLSVFNTVIEPDWRGFLTLELVYHGWSPLRIRAGTGIAQIIFHALSNKASYGDGKYQNQANRPVKAILDTGLK